MILVGDTVSYIGWDLLEHTTKISAIKENPNGKLSYQLETTTFYSWQYEEDIAYLPQHPDNILP